VADTASPSGDQLHIAAGDTQAVVVTLGAGLRSLQHAGRNLLHGYDDATAVPFSRGQVLAPWPNRVADGRYGWDGQTHQLPLTEPSRQCALHGLVAWHEWTLAEYTTDRVRLTTRVFPQPGYEFLLDLEVGYRVTAQGLESVVTATNVGTNAAPYGVGVHPYLQVGDGEVDDCELRLGAATVLSTDDRLIPTGRVPATGGVLDFTDWHSLRGVVLDDAFTDIERGTDGRIWAAVRQGEEVTAIWGDASCGWWQVCTGDQATPPWRRRGVALEPMTCPPNAFATGEDVLTLEPGEHHTVRWGVHDGDPFAR
jgi:aldose 1-epimerase